MNLGTTDPRSRVTRERTDRAVSPVIGVILMVAITVILAAVIGVFVLGLADDLGDGPTQATLSFDGDGSELTIAHDGGDSMDFEAGDYALVLDGSTEDYDLSQNVSLASGESITIDVDEEGSIEFDGDDDPVDVSIRDNNADSTVDSGTVTLDYNG